MESTDGFTHKHTQTYKHTHRTSDPLKVVFDAMGKKCKTLCH